MVHMHPLQVVISYLGWPAAIGSLVLGVAGIATGRAAVVAVGAIMATPFMLYFVGTPRFRLVAAAVLLLYFGASFVLTQNRSRLPKKEYVAAAMTAPYVIFLMHIARTIADQYRS